MAANTAQGSGQLYDWGDGHGRVHTRPKRNRGGSAGVVGAGYGAGAAQTTGPGGYGSGANTLPGVGGVGPAGQGPAAPSALIQPPDPALEAWKANQQLGLGLGAAEATYQRGNLGYETGYNAQGQRDYTNPFNAASLYEEQFKRANLGTTNAMAGASRQGGGQLYSGAYGRQQGENARNLSISLNDLQHQASTGYHGIDVGQATNAIQYGAGSQDQSLAALLKALGVGS